MARRLFPVHCVAGALAGALALIAQAAGAGPPFLTDDPEPTETGHWEIYGPFAEIEGRGTEFSGATGVEINYGAGPGLQLTLGLPVDFARDSGATRWGGGDIEASVKYRVFDDARSHVQIAVFPGVTLPTARTGFGAGRVTALLPIWVQKDAGEWSVFGGGGYAINPGAGNRDFWTGGIALSRKWGERLLVGIEADRDGAGTVGGRATTRLGLGFIHDLGKIPGGRLRLVASGGPTFVDGGGPAGFHAFVALGEEF